MYFCTKHFSGQV
uniref:DNA sequence from clone AEHM-28L23 n=1 Tax=Heliconius melpomene TaxID=34740 RepID=C3PPF9_HELME|nr:unnamed protein product [Heliconius melpomene]